jgi:hypothetical protein
MHQPAELKLTRILWVGPLTVLASVIAVLFVRKIAVSILHPDSSFMPLTIEPPILDTVIASAAAVFVFWKVAQYSLEPVRTYRTLAAKVLVLSFIPDIALATLHGYGGGWPEAAALMAMHVVVWAICVTMLAGLVATKGA